VKSIRILQIQNAENTVKTHEIRRVTAYCANAHNLHQLALSNVLGIEIQPAVE